MPKRQPGAATETYKYLDFKGIDSIAEAVKDLKVDIVLNIQGDEPFVDPRAIDAVAVLLKQNTFYEYI